MKVSIITCCWNSEPYIAECVQSVRMQTYADIEQIFVDGGSTDGTLERIKALDGQGGQVRWVTDVRGGISNAMNVGAGLATGEVIVHLHADDYFAAPDVVERVAAVFSEPGVEWTFGRIDDEVESRRVPQTWTMPPYSYSKLLSRNFIAHPSVFQRRSLFLSSGGFDTSLKYAMDYDLWLRLARLTPPRYLSLVVAVFRRHAGSTSTANVGAAVAEDFMVRCRYVVGSLPRLWHGLVYRWRRWRMGLA